MIIHLNFKGESILCCNSSPIAQALDPGCFYCKQIALFAIHVNHFGLNIKLPHSVSLLRGHVRQRFPLCVNMYSWQRLSVTAVWHHPIIYPGEINIQSSICSLEEPFWRGGQILKASLEVREDVCVWTIVTRCVIEREALWNQTNCDELRRIWVSSSNSPAPPRSKLAPSGGCSLFATQPRRKKPAGV